MAKERILVVDDDEELRGNMAEVLAGAGFEPVQADSGEAAISQMAEGEFALVLLDLLMPGMGGMATLEQLKQRYPRSPVVMITAFASIQNAVEAMHKGANDYIAKPFRINELLATVRRIIEQARFAECRFVFDMDSTFNCLANGLRREILQALGRRKMRFMDIARTLEVDDHTKINFHLKNLREAGLIQQDGRKLYELTAEGRRVIDCMDQMVKALTPR